MDSVQKQFLWEVVDSMIKDGYSEKMAVSSVEKMFNVTLGERETGE